MKSHFIKDTNEQYSIREDGIVISHYYYNAKSNKTIYRYYEMSMTKSKKGGQFDLGKTMIRINNQPQTASGGVLLYEYFKINICRNCGVRTENDIYSINYNCSSCKNISVENRKKYKSEFVKNNKELYKKANKKSRLLHIERLRPKELAAARKQQEIVTKSYVSQSLKISVKDIDDELYNHQKKLILFKREISKEHNIPMQKLQGYGRQ